MKRGGVNSMYGRLDLPQAYALVLTSMARGDVTSAKQVVDAMPSEYYGIRSSHLLNLANAFKSVASVVERELLPVGAELRWLGVLRAATGLDASVTGDIAARMFLCGVMAATGDVAPDEAQHAKAAEIQERVHERFLATGERWGAAEVSVRQHGAAVVHAFDDLCQIVGVSADLVAESHGLNDLPLEELRQQAPEPAALKTWSDVLLELWFDEAGDVVADTPPGR